MFGFIRKGWHVIVNRHKNQVAETMRSNATTISEAHGGSSLESNATVIRNIDIVDNMWTTWNQPHQNSSTYSSLSDTTRDEASMVPSLAPSYQTAQSFADFDEAFSICRSLYASSSESGNTQSSFADLNEIFSDGDILTTSGSEYSCFCSKEDSKLRRSPPVSVGAGNLREKYKVLGGGCSEVAATYLDFEEGLHPEKEGLGKEAASRRADVGGKLELRDPEDDRLPCSTKHAGGCTEVLFKLDSTSFNSGEQDGGLPVGEKLNSVKALQQRLHAARALVKGLSQLAKIDIAPMGAAEARTIISDAGFSPSPETGPLTIEEARLVVMLLNDDPAKRLLPPTLLPIITIACPAALLPAASQTIGYNQQVGIAAIPVEKKKEKGMKARWRKVKAGMGTMTAVYRFRVPAPSGFPAGEFRLTPAELHIMRISNPSDTLYDTALFAAAQGSLATTKVGESVVGGT